VQVAVPEDAVAADLQSAQDEFAQPTTPSGHLDRPRTMAGAIDRGTAVRAAIKAGLLGVLIAIIPLLGIVLTGALAVYFYRRENGFVLPAALGSRLGGAAGVVAFAINALLVAIRIFVFHAREEYADSILKIAQRFGANAADPDFQAGIHSLLTPAGLAMTFFFWMIVTVVLACAGGALASLFMRPPDRRA
jgi:hypothetical protein